MWVFFFLLTRLFLSSYVKKNSECSQRVFISEMIKERAEDLFADKIKNEE